MVVHTYNPNTQGWVEFKVQAHPQHHIKSLVSLGSYMSLLKINK